MEISVIIPVYNLEHLIERTIKSVVNQTFTDWELIIVDDGSTDSTGKVCDRWAAKESRIRVFHIPNSGAAGARYKGMTEAKGRWLSFLDGDDELRPMALELLHNFCNDHRDMIVGNMSKNRNDIYTYDVHGQISNIDFIRYLLLNRTYQSMSAKLFRRETLNLASLQPDRQISQNEDVIMLMQIASEAESIFQCNDIVCYDYLWRDNSVSKSATMPIEGWIRVFSRTHDIISRYNNEDLNRAWLRMTWNRILNHIILKGNYPDIKSSPFAEIASQYHLAFPESECHRILAILNSKNRMRTLYWKKLALFRIKRCIKKLIGWKK